MKRKIDWLKVIFYGLALIGLLSILYGIYQDWDVDPFGHVPGGWV